MVRKTISIALIASLAATGAQAALLTNVQGAVTVNRGYGYGPAGTGGVITPGDRVRAPEGSADIVYDNGCIVRVDPGQTVIVLSPPPACHIASEVWRQVRTMLVGGGSGHWRRCRSSNSAFANKAREPVRRSPPFLDGRMLFYLSGAVLLQLCCWGAALTSAFWATWPCSFLPSLCFVWPFGRPLARKALIGRTRGSHSGSAASPPWCRPFSFLRSI